jgi:hypothetical protein
MEILTISDDMKLLHGVSKSMEQFEHHKLSTSFKSPKQGQSFLKTVWEYDIVILDCRSPDMGFTIPRLESMLECRQSKIRHFIFLAVDGLYVKLEEHGNVRVHVGSERKIEQVMLDIHTIERRADMINAKSSAPQLH